MTRKRIHRGVVVAMLLVPLAGAGCTRNPVTGKKELILISPAEEIALGRQAAPQFEQQFGGPVPDRGLQQYVASIGRKVAGVADRSMPYEFALLASSVPNAFALPGGKVYVTAGLMAHMTNERQLAAVLGHEVGHVAAKHNVKQIQNQLGVAILAEIAGAAVGAEGGQAAKQITQVVGAMINLRYSRQDEYQADALGIKYMARAGYNPWGMVELLETLMQMSQSEGGSVMEIFQTHPLTSKRIAEAKGIVTDRHRASSRETPDPNAARFVQARTRLSPFIKQLPGPGPQQPALRPDPRKRTF